MTRNAVTIGPFSIFFTNVNRVMHLPGHSHFATVTFVYQTGNGNRGFPAFASTYAAVQERLVELTAKPFHDMTNEDVAAQLYHEFATWDHPEIARWGGSFVLGRLELAVRGVPDRIGHADGFTVYSVERDDVVNHVADADGDRRAS